MLIGIKLCLVFIVISSYGAYNCQVQTLFSKLTSSNRFWKEISHASVHFGDRNKYNHELLKYTGNAPKKKVICIEFKCECKH